MKYKVIPFIASLQQKNATSDKVATQLETIINQYAEQGWIYERLESVTTFIAPTNGCFGLGGKPGYTTSRQMIVFKKS